MLNIVDIILSLILFPLVIVLRLFNKEAGWYAIESFVYVGPVGNQGGGLRMVTGPFWFRWQARLYMPNEPHGDEKLVVCWLYHRKPANWPQAEPIWSLFLESRR